MAILIPNTFSSYDLTEDEEKQGAILTNLQLQVMQNHLATVAEEKLSLTVDPNNMQQFLMEDAYKRGQIDLILYFMEVSRAMSIALASKEDDSLVVYNNESI